MYIFLRKGKEASVVSYHLFAIALLQGVKSKNEKNFDARRTCPTRVIYKSSESDDAFNWRTI